MTLASFALRSFVFLVVAVSQVNIQQPCIPKSELLADGKIQITDCSGKSRVVDPNDASVNSDKEPPSSPVTTVNMQMSSKVEEAYEQFEISSLDYERERLARNTRVFAWQDTSSKIIFVIVLLTVMTGLVLAGLQFKAAADM